MLKALLLDLSGVLYQGTHALPGALDALDTLRAGPLALRFVTNTSRRGHRQLRNDLAERGFEVGVAELFTAPRAAHDWLKERDLHPWCLIHPNLAEDFADLDQSRPNAVLVGDAEHDFHYRNLDQAFRLLMDGAPLVAMGVNRHFQLDDGLHLDAGPFVRALEYAADCQATVTGKPSGDFFRQVLADLGCEADQAMMIGDDAVSDVQGALEAGLHGCLVKTGKYRHGDANRISGDFWLEEDIGSVVKRLEQAL